jgi:hypothetical protein
MPNPIVTSTEFIGSHEKAKNSYGQNGSSQSPSLTPGQHKSPIADVSPKQTIVPGQRVEDTLAHRVKMNGDTAAAITPHPGHRSRIANHEGGTVPSANVRRAAGH